jgi:monovalent cation/proton antiporter MnhG/PhaG subunit
MIRLWAIEALLSFAVVIAWISSFGIVAMRSAYDRLHYVTPITTLSTIAVAVAVLMEEPFSQAGVKVVLTALLLLGSNAVLAHATASAAHYRKSRRSAAGDDHRRGKDRKS